MGGADAGGVDLAVGRGEFLGLIGPNGSGKSTLLNIVLGLIRPTSGEVRLFGQDPAPHATSAGGLASCRSG